VGAAVLIPFLTASALLLLAGAEKTRKPHYTREALDALGLPGGTVAIRALGAVEICAGGVAIASTLGLPSAPIVAAGAVAVLYAAFGVVVLRLMTSGVAVRSCGCLGSADTPPSYPHVAVNLACALAAVLWAIEPTTLGAATGGRPLVVAVAIGSAGLALYLTNAVILWLSAVWRVTNPSAAGDRPAV
jgi:hypothetical protein